MKTIYTTLPIYDSLAKRDWQRTGALIPVYTPRHRLPSWQYSTTETPGAVTRIDLVSLAGSLTDITSYFPTLSDAVALTSETYYKYDGDTLIKPLPLGSYYLKITHTNGYYFYSEWITITDIYPNLVTSLVGNGTTYDTFTIAGGAITSGINNAGGAISLSNAFDVRKGEVIYVVVNFTWTSGEYPNVSLIEIAGTDISNIVTLTGGLNYFTLAATKTSSIATFGIVNTNAANFATFEIIVFRAYSPTFIKIDFHDTHDLGDILYQSGFTQSAWLNVPLNTPTHEPVMIGEEKNGIFITEKIVTKFNFRIIAYIGPVLYRGLIRLPQHDDISITDEVGFVYTPRTGNIEVKPINWNWFDTGTIEISFNNNDEFIWVSESNNLS